MLKKSKTQYLGGRNYVKYTGSRRHELDIYFDILVSALNRSLKSHIAGNTRLNYKFLSNHMEVLLRNKLLISDDDGESKTYYITAERGMKFIELYITLTTQVEFTR